MLSLASRGKRNLEDVFSQDVIQPSKRVCRPGQLQTSRKAKETSKPTVTVSVPKAKSRPAAGSGKSKPRTARGRSSSLSVTKSTRKSTTSLRTRKIKKKKVGDVFCRLDVNGAPVVDAKRHAAEHPNPYDHQDTCARCRFLARKHLWRELGSCRLPGQSEQLKLTWLTERPSHLGGAWGIGCAACANLLSRLGGDTKGMRLRVGTKWATYSVRTWSNMQAESIKILGFVSIGCGRK